MSQPRHPFEMFQDILSDDWDRIASRSGADPDRWFPEGRGNYFMRDVKRICATCPVIRQCAQRALDYGEVHGFWAGLNAGGPDHDATVATWKAIAEGVTAA